MKNKLLLPYKYKKWGWILILLSSPFYLFAIFDFESFYEKMLEVGVYFNLNQFDFAIRTVSIANYFFLAGAVLVLLTKEKAEDEFLIELKLNTLIQAIVFSFLITLVSMVVFWNSNYFHFMNSLNIVWLLLFFVLRFNYQVHFKYKTVTDD